MVTSRIFKESGEGRGGVGSLNYENGVGRVEKCVITTYSIKSHTDKPNLKTNKGNVLPFYTIQSTQGCLDTIMGIGRVVVYAMRIGGRRNKGNVAGLCCILAGDG